MVMLILIYMVLYASTGIFFMFPFWALIYSVLNAVMFAFFIFMFHLDIKVRSWKIPLAAGLVWNALSLIHEFVSALGLRSSLTVNGIVLWQDGIPSGRVVVALTAHALVTVLIGIVAYHLGFQRLDAHGADPADERSRIQS